jgi:hypothetical protein
MLSQCLQIVLAIRSLISQPDMCLKNVAINVADFLETKLLPVVSHEVATLPPSLADKLWKVAVLVRSKLCINETRKQVKSVALSIMKEVV